MRLAVQLPEGEDLNEWLAVHGTSDLLRCVQGAHTETLNDAMIATLIAVDFFNHLNMLYGTVTEFCTPQEVCVRYPTEFIRDLLDTMDRPASVRSCLQVLGKRTSFNVVLPIPDRSQGTSTCGKTA